jgi:hypothetical protein
MRDALAREAQKEAKRVFEQKVAKEAKIRAKLLGAGKIGIVGTRSRASGEAQKEAKRVFEQKAAKEAKIRTELLEAGKIS